VATIENVLARVFISSTCISFSFVNFLIDKVFLSFKDTRSGFELIFSNTQFYIDKHNSLTKCWIGLDFRHKILKVLFYMRLKFHSNKYWEGLAIRFKKYYVIIVLIS